MIYVSKSNNEFVDEHPFKEPDKVAKHLADQHNAYTTANNCDTNNW
jgi:hypothetical protein